MTELNYLAYVNDFESCLAYVGLVAQSCLTLCDPTDCRLAGSSVHGILQARILEGIAIPFSSESRLVVSSSLQPHGLYGPWNSPGHNTGGGSRSLLQEIFPTQGLNPGLLHCKQILYQLSHQRSPKLEPLLWSQNPTSYLRVTAANHLYSPLLCQLSYRRV